MKNNRKSGIHHSPYDVIIVGAGVTGTALSYVLAKYSSVQRVLLIEKNASAAQVNSHGCNNSQTLHVGDIETNYSLEKARAVKKGAEMILSYASDLPQNERNAFLFPVQKMILAVGKSEVAELEKRYTEFKDTFPDLKKLSRAGIAAVEPAVMRDRNPAEPVLALMADGYAVNFGKLAGSLLKDAEASAGKKLEIKFNTKVESVRKDESGQYVVTTNGGMFKSKTLVVAAGSHSLLYAKMLGCGKNFSIIPVAGNFYYTPKVLRGKVYTMQSKKLPFSAVHGDPDVVVPGKTRFGPTAKFFPVLERGKYDTFFEYIRSAGLDLASHRSFLTILSDVDILVYLVKNILYDIPWIGKKLYLKSAQKIVPSLTAQDLTFAKGVGGMRMQIVDKTKRALVQGEGQIIGQKSIFNLTPSPGASVCIANAHRDAQLLVSFLGDGFRFDGDRFRKDFID